MAFLDEHSNELPSSFSWHNPHCWRKCRAKSRSRILSVGRRQGEGSFAPTREVLSMPNPSRTGFRPRCASRITPPKPLRLGPTFYLAALGGLCLLILIAAVT